VSLVEQLPIGKEGAVQLARAADLLARYRYQVWAYGDSIGFEGLLAADELFGHRRYEGWAHGAVKAWAVQIEPLRERDNTAPGHAMCLLYERRGDSAILDAAGKLVVLLERRRRLEGVFAAFERAPLIPPFGGESLPADDAALLRDPGAGVFVDCLHFDPPLFTHLGALTDDRRLIDLGAEQLLAATSLLQDESGFFWHFWLEKTRQRYGYAWSRGQCWALLGLLDTLEYLPVAHPSRSAIVSSLQRLARALADSQDETGGWPAVARDGGSGPESSTAAFVAAGFAEGLRQGYLDNSYADRARAAWRHTWERVNVRGVLTGVSAGVAASTAASHYRNTPVGWVVPWGQGPLLLAAKRMALLAS
jgi:unsaturated rhamnogalacturonyl hydrolase